MACSSSSWVTLLLQQNFVRYIFFIWKWREKTSNCLKNANSVYLRNAAQCTANIKSGNSIFRYNIFFCHFSTCVHFPSSPYPNVFLSCIFWVDFFSLLASLFFVLACFSFCMFTINEIEHTETSIMMNGLTLFERSTIKCNFLLQWCNFCISIEFCTILFYFH